LTDVAMFNVLVMGRSLVRRLQAAHSDLAVPLDAELEADARRVSGALLDIVAQLGHSGRGFVTQDERRVAARDLNSILVRLEDLKKAVAGADVLEVTALDDLLVRMRRAVREVAADEDKK